MALKPYGVWLCFSLVTVLAGCVNSARMDPVRVAGEPESDLGRASLPEFYLGDRVTFANGRTEEVVEITGDQVLWKRSANRRHRSSRDFVLPDPYYESRRKKSIERVEANVTGLWPLKLGNSSSFYSEKETLNKIDTGLKPSYRFWRCRVSGTARVAVPAGTFDTYRIACFRSDELHKFKQQRVWYYAPDLGHDVVRIDYRKKHPPKVRELMALRRGTPWLDKTAVRKLGKARQESLEKIPTGKTKVWRAKDGKTVVKFTPVNTLRLEDGTVCRNYVQQIDYAGKTIQEAALRCRNDQGKWRVPKRRISNDKPFFAAKK